MVAYLNWLVHWSGIFNNVSWLTETSILGLSWSPWYNLSGEICHTVKEIVKSMGQSAITILEMK